MTPKERMLIAMRNGKPDRVPCAPDTSNIIPARMTGKDWWDVFLHRDPPIWKAYNNVVKHFGFDGWNLFGDEGFRLIEPGRVETEKKTVRRTETEIDVQTIYHTPKGDLTETWRYFSKNTPFCIEGKVKDLAADFAKIEYLYPDIEGYDASLLDEIRADLGDRGVVGVIIGFPGIQSCFWDFNGGAEAAIMEAFDRPDLFGKYGDMQYRYLAKKMDTLLEARDHYDFIMFGGSGAITVGGPENFKKYGLPFIRQMASRARAAGVPTELHCCGKERILFDLLAGSDVDCMNPLEPPEQGDCDLREIKQKFGNQFALMGNLHTSKVMEASPDVVEAAAIRAIEDAAAGGGFILSTADQCGAGCTEANVFKMMEVAEKYGQY